VERFGEAVAWQGGAVRAGEEEQEGDTDVAAGVLQHVGEQVADGVVEQLRVIPNLCTAYFTILLLRSCASRKHFSLAARYSR
jgi:hypothetical protein